MNKLRAVLAFVLVQCVMWGFAWLCGYNFDTRNFLVAFWVVTSLSFSLTAAAFAYVWGPEVREDLIKTVMGD